MQRLSGLDASFLYFETPRVHTHVVATVVVDTSTMPGGYTFEAIRALVASRLPRLEPLTRKLATVPFNIHYPVWVKDGDIDIDFHVRRIGCPRPGTLEQLAEVTSDIAGRPLDRSRPLWEIWAVEGLEQERVGLVMKMHHATVDGVTGANLMVHLFDLEPVVPPASAEAVDLPEGERAPSDLELVGHAVLSRVRKPLPVARTLAKTAQGAVRFVTTRRRRDTGSGMPAPFTAPRTPFNAPLSAHRKAAFVNVSLDDVKAVKHSFGTTVNDVVLAVCGGALRAYLEKTGHLPDRSLTAVIPVSVRALDGSSGNGGANQVSAMFTTLATEFDDPVERLRAIHDTNKGAKEEHHAIGADLLQNWAEFAAPNTFSLAARVYTALRVGKRTPPPYNAIISNVPGPDFPLYVAGGRIEALYPLGPLLDGLGLNITVLSYLNSVGFGFMADRDAMPNLWDLARFVPEALEELLAAGG